MSSIQVLAVLAFFVVAAICIAVTALKKDFREGQDSNPETFDQKLADWKKKVGKARHLLTGKFWWEPDGKEEFIQAVYNGGIPEYLFYALGDQTLSTEHIQDIKNFFWRGQSFKFGDFELHNSGNPRIGALLRIRDPKQLAPELMIGGYTCPLYQTGRSYFGDETPGCVNFMHLMEEKTVA